MDHEKDVTGVTFAISIKPKFFFVGCSLLDHEKACDMCDTCDNNKHKVFFLSYPLAIKCAWT
jgi:hypothetical protein